MRSRFPELVPAALVALLLFACERELRHTEGPSNLSARPASQAPEDYEHKYEHNAEAISEGQRLFAWFNCVGCHAHGGGGIGPPLMDDQWIYGGAPEDIYATILEGRPNGMPSFRNRIPEQQLWQIVAFVRSLSGKAPKDAVSPRDDHMRVKEAQRSRPGAAPAWPPPATPPGS